MKIISIILIVIGLLLCAIGSFGTHFFVHHVMHDIMNAAAGGIGSVASGLTNSWYMSFVAMFGCVIMFFGVVLNLIVMFREKKQTN